MSEALCESSGEAGSFPRSSAQPIKLKPQSASGSPCGSPRMSPCDSPRNSPRHSPLLFRKLLMNRSVALQRRFTLAHTPR
ncbi:cAMP-specific 3',5'-cyclic phosphodiesterase 4C isoform X3 [Lates japonicus]|uniref:cAMP-specific 3',5'-cyclic phosphodiesterase 4C isoform X3 n=1 Tax=Lates japonicus TaxID=270547 RepID=A0AAD3QZB1_LATJO|nr:cAMP-specific 3',5'-cyclic phosphodiesterase 4C isoform X3 [Lates japonicus]